METWTLKRGAREYVAKDVETLLQWASEGRVEHDDKLRPSSRLTWANAGDLPWLAVFFGRNVILRCPGCPGTLRISMTDRDSVTSDVFRCPDCSTSATLGWARLDSDAPLLLLKEKAHPTGSRQRESTSIGRIVHPAVACPSRDEQIFPTELISVQASWELTAADRLAELLSDADFRAILGTFDRTIRFNRKLLEGEDRPSRKSEMAKALLVQYAEDLFAEKKIRERVARGAGVECPQRWSPGKAAALKFVSDCQFPVELAGIPSDTVPPDFEFLEGKVELRELQDFQLEVRTKVLNHLASSDPRAIVTLPTGAGKTRVAVDAVKEWLTQRVRIVPRRPKLVIWLAHTEELCEQAYACFKEVWGSSTDICPLYLFRFWGRFMSDLERHTETLLNVRTSPAVMISTPARLSNLAKSTDPAYTAIRDILRETIALLIIDEAHRAAAPSYRQIIGHFRRQEPIPVFGLTATPFRKEYHPRDPEAGTRELAEIFGENLVEPTDILGSDCKSMLQARGVLAATQVRAIETKTSVKLPRRESRDFLSSDELESIDRLILAEINQPTRRHLIFREILPFCKDEENSILYFGPTVEDAECMAYLLRERGVPSAALSGATRTPVRRRVIREFKLKKIRVICNCQVLTTGFDAPKVTHVVMARPTVSRVLYEQMVGRGLRGPVFGGTDLCTIIDFEDRYRPTDWPRPAYEMFREMWKPVIL
jgi:DNA repair protein RadD